MASIDIELDDDFVPPSVESQLDYEDDFDNHNSSQDSSHNEIDNLIENLSDEIRGGNSDATDDNSINSDEETNEPERAGENNRDIESDHSDVVDAEDLAVDRDNLEGNNDDPATLFDLLNKDPEWSETFQETHVKQFQGSRRCKLPHEMDTATSTPLDYFKLFISDTVLEKICTNTNKYVHFCVNQKRILRPNFTEKYWEDTFLDEMKAFIGLAVLFGIHNQPRYKNYWSQNPLLGNKEIQKIFTLRRYQKLSEYLHVSDRESEHPRGHQGYDKLSKIRWLLDHVNDAFPRYKNPERHQSIDEGTIAFTGRCSYIQYNKSKPQKRGIKTYIRTCASSAYCQQLIIYLGKDNANPSLNGCVFDTVWDLVKNIAGKYHCIYFDNWYTSIPLLRFLYARRTYACGTIRQNRKLLPNKIRSPPTKLARGQFITMQSKRLANLTVTIWKDTREVRFASTLSKPHISTHGHRRVGGRHVQVPMPSVSTAYGKYMGGVDKLDRYISKRVYGSLAHGARKIWRHIFWYIINVCIANSWVLYSLYSTRQTVTKRYDHMAFRLELAEELINGFTSRQRNPTECTIAKRPKLDELSGHVMVHSDSKRPKRCKPHKDHKPNNKPRRETIYMCLQCNQHMCPDCFRIIHLPRN